MPQTEQNTSVRCNVEYYVEYNGAMNEYLAWQWYSYKCTTSAINTDGGSIFITADGFVRGRYPFSMADPREPSQWIDNVIVHGSPE